MKTSLITVGVSIALASSMGTAVAGGDSPFYLTGGLQNSNFDVNGPPAKAGGLNYG